jgi:hypothetical protein
MTSRVLISTNQLIRNNGRPGHHYGGVPGKHYQDVFGTYRFPAEGVGFPSHANHVLLYSVLARPASGFHMVNRKEGSLGESLESKMQSSI